MGLEAILALIASLLPQIQAGVGEAVPLLQQLAGAVENIFKGQDPTADQIAAAKAARKLVVAAVDKG